MNKELFAAIRYWGGYMLFGGVIVYAFYHAPDEIWRLKLQWVAGAAVAMFAMMLLQMLQVVVFLRFHEVEHGWYWPTLFTVKKGILNAVLPARSGTLVLMRILTQRYPVKWHQYLRFSLVAASASLLMSGLAVAWLVLSNAAFLFIFVGCILGSYFLSRFFPTFYVGRYLTLLAIALGLYGTMLLAFWCLLRGLNISVGFKDASYFATAVNTLAQLPLTPGNMGIREVVTGMVAPYVRLDPSVGILAGGIFHVVRTAVYGLVMITSEWLAKVYPELSMDVSSNRSTTPKPLQVRAEGDDP